MESAKLPDACRSKDAPKAVIVATKTALVRPAEAARSVIPAKKPPIAATETHAMILAVVPSFAHENAPSTLAPRALHAKPSAIMAVNASPQAALVASTNARAANAHRVFIAAQKTANATIVAKTATALCPLAISKASPAKPAGGAVIPHVAAEPSVA